MGLPEGGARGRAEEFCRRFGLRAPILQAPMAGACPAGLAAAVANAGGMGGLGALMTMPDGIAAWATDPARQAIEALIVAPHQNGERGRLLGTHQG